MRARDISNYIKRHTAWDDIAGCIVLSLIFAGVAWNKYRPSQEFDCAPSGGLTEKQIQMLPEAATYGGGRAMKNYEWTITGGGRGGYWQKSKPAGQLKL